MAHYTYYAWVLYDEVRDKWHELPTMKKAKDTHGAELRRAVQGLGYALYLRRYTEYGGYTGYAKVEGGKLPRYFNSGYKVPAAYLTVFSNLKT